MRNDRPLFTVATATHNGSRYLAATIASVRAQSFEDWEYLVVDDASSDDSAAIVEEAAQRDRRIRLIRTRSNVGPAASLNVALREARGALFANLDHDDLAVPDRLQRQAEVLAQNPRIGVCGGAMRVVDEFGAIVDVITYAAEHESIHWRLTTQCEVCHSTASMRTDLLREIGGYAESNWTACDYDLFLRLRSRTRFANLEIPLVDYRLHRMQTSRMRFRQQIFALQLLLLAHRPKGRDSALTFDEIFYFILGRNGEQFDSVQQLHAASTAAAVILNEYVEVHRLSESAYKMARADCARWLATMALRHRTVYRDVARQLAATAGTLDPKWRHSPVLRAMLNNPTWDAASQA